MGGFSSLAEDVFANDDVLRDDFVPDELIARDEQREDYISALRPIYRGSQPNNVFVYGDTGVGKTVATKMILDELQEDLEETDVELRVVWANCKGSSSYGVSVALVNQLREPDEQISESGHGQRAVLNMLWDELNSVAESHVVFVLDEVDSLGSDDDLLYQIPRAKSNGNINDDVDVGLIGISNDFSFRDNLSARVQSTLCEREIHFPPYDAEQLQTILSDRAEEAFVDGALDDGVIELVAALAAQETGSARQALDVLRKAGERSNKRKDGGTVTDEHVREAFDAVERELIAEELEALPSQSHVILGAIHALSKAGETPVRRKRIYEVYSVMCDAIGMDQKANRTVHRRLSDLSLKGFLAVSEHNQGPHGGNKYRYTLDVRGALVDRVLREHRLGDAIGDDDSFALFV
jgi:cell division control protein 6